MLKGSIEWEYEPGEGLTIHIKHPPGEFDKTRGRVREAGKEMLLLLRNLIDAAVNHIEEAEKKSESQHTKIDVE